MSGLYHIVGDEVHGRKAVVEQFLEFLQLSTNVSEKKLEEFPFHDKRPLRFSMSNEKFVGETGYEFTTINDLFKKYI
jgi:dTDP-4-dehydrorhamnose reductase